EDPGYYALRPTLAIARDEVVQLSLRAGLHPSLAPLLPLWKDGELALLQGVGYPEPNLSHFRSIEIWDTASASDLYLQDGWLTRTFAATPPPRAFAADGRRAQQGIPAHPQGRSRHRAGRNAPRRPPRVQDRVSIGRLRQRDPHRLPGARQSGRYCSR